MKAGTESPSCIPSPSLRHAPMRRLKALGWGAKRIAAELGCSKTTVKDWLRRGEWRPCAKPSRSKQLDGLIDWLAARFRQHAGNADVVRQDLATEKGIHVSLRTVERAVAPCARTWSPRPGRRCGSRRSRANRCRSTSASAG